MQHTSTQTSTSFVARRRLFSAVAAVPLLAGLLLSGTAQADPPAARGEKGARMCQKLGCTEQQKEQMTSVMQQMRTDIAPDKQAIKELRTKMMAEFAKDKPNEKELRRLQAEVGKHHQEIAERRLEGMLEMHALLTPDQRKEFAKMAAERRDRKHHRRGKGKGKGKVKGKGKGKVKQ